MFYSKIGKKIIQSLKNSPEDWFLREEMNDWALINGSFSVQVFKEFSNVCLAINSAQRYKFNFFESVKVRKIVSRRVGSYKKQLKRKEREEVLEKLNNL